MADTELSQDLQEQAGEFAKQVLTVLIDTVYLVVWVCAQWLTARIIDSLELSGMDRWMLVAFQVVFAISTFVVVGLWIYKDLAVAWYRAKRRIERERDWERADG